MAREVLIDPEVLEKTRVGDVLEVREQTPSIGERSTVLHGKSVTLQIHLAVSVKIVELNLPLGPRRQVAQVRVELQAAQGHVTRLERQIVVRRKVEIVGCGDV